MSFIIGFCSPINVRSFSSFLQNVDKSFLELGIGGDAVNRIAVGLLESGYSIEIFTLDFKVTEPIVLQGNNIVIHIFPLRPKRFLYDFFRKEIRFLSNAIKNSNVDIIHAHWTYEYAIAALKCKKPHVITVRDHAIQILRLFPDKIYRLMRLLMNEFVLFKAQYLVANSPYIECSIRKRVRGRIIIIPNSIDSISPKSQDRQLNWATPVLISINNGFSKTKNVQNLLRAFSIVRNSVPCVKLVLVGKDFGKNGIAHNWAENHSLFDGVDFRGVVDQFEIKDLLANSDLLVHPSIEESFGNTLIEAMAQGTPCIGGAKSSAVPWVLNFGRSGVLTDVMDPAQICESIFTLIKHSDTWKSYSLAGIENVRNRFLVKNVVKEHIFLYNQILGL